MNRVYIPFKRKLCANGSGQNRPILVGRATQPSSVLGSRKGEAGRSWMQLCMSRDVVGVLEASRR